MTATPAARSIDRSSRLAALWRYLPAAWAWVVARPWLALPLLALPALWPYYSEGLPRGQDLIMHLMRLGLLDAHIREGTLFPRWMPELMLGRGYPVLNFYGPLTYYLIVPFRLAGLSYYQAFIAGSACMVLAAGFGMYLFARDVFGRDHPGSALVAATAYMYAPYLLTNIFVRGAQAEAGAMAILPYIFWSLRRLACAERPAAYLLPVALSLGGLAITHNVTLIFVPVIMVAYLVVLWLQFGHPRGRILWMAACLLLAFGVSAFFTLPLLLERVYLVPAPYEELKKNVIPANVWSWRNFMEVSFAFVYTYATPFRLGLVQAMVAAAGAIAARRRDAEWLFFAFLAIAAGLGISGLSLPVWLHSQTLQMAQFPWRLLSIMSMPLALLTGGLVLRLRGRYTSLLATLALLAIIIAANRPQLAWMNVLSPSATIPTPAAIAQLETDNRVLGASGIQEFRPVWAKEALAYAPESNLAQSELDVVSVRENSYDLTFSYRSPAGGPLRFSTFYFPGWQVILDRVTPLATYPSTNLGWLTIDLPPGTHTVEKRWVGTPLEHAAGVLTIVTLLLLTWLVWHYTEQPGWAALPLLLAAVGAFVMLASRSPVPLLIPQQPFAAAGIRLVGVRFEQAPPDGQEPAVDIYPFWHVDATPPEGLILRWQLQDKSGRVLADVAQPPYFGTDRYQNWPASSLVRDAYHLALPPNLPAGRYQVAIRAEQAGAAPIGGFAVVGSVDLNGTGPDAVPANAVDVRLDRGVRLAGYDLERNGQAAPSAGGAPVVVRPGDHLAYTLYWQALGPLLPNYHGFVHLVDAVGHPLAQQDQLPGPEFRPPALWSPARLQPDRYLLRVPPDARGGLYWPLVGLYDFSTGDRLTAYRLDGQELASGLRLPPVKVLGTNPPPPQHPLQTRFADLADLTGYDLQVPSSGLRPGSALTVTLYYRDQRRTSTSYTRFLHLHDPVLGMAAQADGLPQAGANPTWAWVPGETIQDQVVLRIAPGAQPGHYTLATGLYDPAAAGARLPVIDAQARAVPDNQVVLADLEVLP